MVNPNLESIEIAPGATVSLEVDLKRNTYSYVINSEGIEYFVEYLLDGDLKAYTIGDWGIEDGATITEDLNIMPTFKPKEYGWVIV